MKRTEVKGKIIMGLRLICGRAGSGKSTYCMQQIKDLIINDAQEQIFLLVPEQFTLQAEKKLVSLVGGGGIIKAEVISFKRLAHRVFAVLGGVSFSHISQAGKSIVISKILQENKNKLDYFESLIEHKSFVDSISTLIKEFKRYNVTPSMLLAHADNVDCREKVRQLAVIFEEYEKTVNSAYRDSDDDLTIMVKKLAGSNMYKDAVFFIDEFAGFTPQEFEAVSVLLKVAKEINIAFCTDEIKEDEPQELDIFAQVKWNAVQLINRAKSENINIEKIINLSSNLIGKETEVCPVKFAKSREIAHIEKNFYKFPNEIYDNKDEIDNSVEIFAATNIFAEVENVACNIIGLCRDKGYRFSDISVVCRNLDTYERLVDVIFRSYDIPFFIDKKNEVTKHALIKLTLSLFEILTGNWSYETVFTYLKTGMAGISLDELDLIENYVMACGIYGSRWTMEGDWTYTRADLFQNADADYTIDYLAKINEIRKKIITPIMRFAQSASGRKTPRQICTALYDYIVELKIPETVEEIIEKLRKNCELGLANEYSQVLGTLMDVCDQLVEVLDDKGIGLKRFAKFFEVGLGQYKIGSIPPALDQVMVGSVDRSRSSGVKALFVMGVNDGVFPAATFEEGLLCDNDRIMLKRAGVRLADTTIVKTFEERFLVYRTLTTASQKLWISFSISDTDGRALRPSGIIHRLKRLLPTIQIVGGIGESVESVESVELQMQRVCATIPTFNEMIFQIAKSREEDCLGDVWTSVFKWYLRRDSYRAKIENIFDALSYKNEADNLNMEYVSKLYGSPMQSSVSKFESYFMCPFSFFIKYGLKARERRIFNISFPDIGNFLHMTVEKFSKELANNDLSWRNFEQVWAVEMVKKIVEEMLVQAKQSPYAQSARFLSLSRKLTRVVNRVISIISEQVRRGNFEPFGYEMSFAQNGDFPPITIELDTKEKITLTGRIDRVDVLKRDDGTYVRIVDYKSGQKKLNLNDVYHGLQIQLLTYFNAICENGTRGLQKPIKPGGVFYFRFNDPLIKAKLDISEEELEKKIMKQLKMQGFMLADVSLVKEMDTDIKGHSLIVPARLNTDGTLGGSSSTLTADNFALLSKYLNVTIKNTANKMLNGEIGITPYKKPKESACKFCGYISICQFDPRINSSLYNNIQIKDDDEVLGMMQNFLKDKNV